MLSWFKWFKRPAPEGKKETRAQRDRRLRAQRDSLPFVVVYSQDGREWVYDYYGSRIEAKANLDVAAKFIPAEQFWIEEY